MILDKFGSPVVDELAASRRVWELAEEIQNNKQLRKIVMDARSDMRRAVYELIAPHITKFKPLPYFMLVK